MASSCRLGAYKVAASSDVHEVRKSARHGAYIVEL